ncbi:hypothetical protein FD754_024267, partial [Muntiacus muntjak]
VLLHFTRSSFRVSTVHCAPELQNLHSHRKPAEATMLGSDAGVREGRPTRVEPGEPHGDGQRAHQQAASATAPGTPRLGFSQMSSSIRDVSKWSERTRKPLEALYGFDYFARTCEKWVDGIEQFKHLPDGSICRDLLPLVQCPTLIVHGEKDPLVPRFHADFLHRHVRGSRFHLMPEGKHNLHLRFADEFNKLAEDFLR